MIRRIKTPGDTPAEAYRFWHRRWCEILSDEPPADLLAGGRAGWGFTERVPDAPDEKSYFSYAIDREGRVAFMGARGRPSRNTIVTNSAFACWPTPASMRVNKSRRVAFASFENPNSGLHS